MKAVGKEIQNGMNTVPKPFFEEASIKYFKPEVLNRKKTLKLAYYILLNENQQMLFDALIKLLCWVFIPGLELVHIYNSNTHTAKRKKIAKWIGFSLQLIVLNILAGLI